MYRHIFIIYSSIDRYLNGLHNLAIINRAPETWGAGIPRTRFALLGYVPRNGVVGSNSRSNFVFDRNLHPDFDSDRTNLQSLQQLTWVPFSQDCCQYLFVFSVTVTVS